MGQMCGFTNKLVVARKNIIENIINNETNENLTLYCPSRILVATSRGKNCMGLENIFLALVFQITRMDIVNWWLQMMIFFKQRPQKPKARNKVKWAKEDYNDDMCVHTIDWTQKIELMNTIDIFEKLQ